MIQKIIISMLLAVFSQMASAQFAVTDPASYVYFAQQLENGAEMYESAQEQVRLLKLSAEAYQKINKTLNTMSTIASIASDVKYTTEYIGRTHDELREMRKSDIDIVLLNRQIASINTVGKQVILILSDIQTILSDNKLRLSDGERLLLIQKKIEELEELRYRAFSVLKRTRQASQVYRWTKIY